MARNYDRGYAPEAQARDTILPAHGFVAWRSWASKGPFDLYASRGDMMLLIQVKRTKSRIVSPEAVATLCKQDIHGDGKKKIGMKNIPTPANCKKQVWLYSDKCVGKDLAGWRYYAIEGETLVPLAEPVPDWDAEADCRWENLAEGLTGGEDNDDPEPCGLARGRAAPYGPAPGLAAPGPARQARGLAPPRSLRGLREDHLLPGVRSRSPDPGRETPAPVLLGLLHGCRAGLEAAGMTPRCEICGAAIPDLPEGEGVAQGYRELTWEGRGPFYFCPAHSLDAILLWTAETLVCDRRILAAVRERQGVRP